MNNLLINHSDYSWLLYNVSAEMEFNLLLLRELFLFFIHLKLELLTQFPTSNDENYLYIEKIRYLQYWIIGFPKHLQQIVHLDMKGCICHFVKWQIHPFISKGTKYVIKFSDIFIDLKHAWNQIYTVSAAHGFNLKTLNYCCRNYGYQRGFLI